MRISSSNLPQELIGLAKQQGLTFKLGDILDARVVKVMGERALLQIKGQTVVAEMEAAVKPGDELKLRVAGEVQSKFILKVMNDQTQNSGPTDQLLRSLGIKPDGEARSALTFLLKNSLPVNTETLRAIMTDQRASLSDILLKLVGEQTASTGGTLTGQTIARVDGESGLLQNGRASSNQMNGSGSFLGSDHNTSGTTAGQSPNGQANQAGSPLSGNGNTASDGSVHGQNNGTGQNVGNGQGAANGQSTHSGQTTAGQNVANGQNANTGQNGAAQSATSTPNVNTGQNGNTGQVQTQLHGEQAANGGRNAISGNGTAGNISGEGSTGNFSGRSPEGIANSSQPGTQTSGVKSGGIASLGNSFFGSNSIGANSDGSSTDVRSGHSAGTSPAANGSVGSTRAAHETSATGANTAGTDANTAKASATNAANQLKAYLLETLLTKGALDGKNTIKDAALQGALKELLAEGKENQSLSHLREGGMSSQSTTDGRGQIGARLLSQSTGASEQILSPGQRLEQLGLALNPGRNVPQLIGGLKQLIENLGLTSDNAGPREAQSGKSAISTLLAQPLNDEQKGAVRELADKLLGMRLHRQEEGLLLHLEMPVLFNQEPTTALLQIREGEAHHSETAGQGRPLSIYFRLETEQLGQLKVLVLMRDEELNFQFASDRERTRTLLRKSVPDLKGRFEAMAYKVNQMGISVLVEEEEKVEPLPGQVDFRV